MKFVFSSEVFRHWIPCFIAEVIGQLGTRLHARDSFDFKHGQSQLYSHPIGFISQ